MKGIPADWWRDFNSYWFETLSRDDWFTSSPAVDDQLRTRFLDLHERIAEATLDARSMPAEAVLAAVLALDQLPRNLFRDTPRAFATDAKARALTLAALAANHEASLSVDRRLFLYLPLEHSEDLCDQIKSVELISQLGDDGYTRYAKAHHDIIARFGRFPHRNAILARTSTDEERAFLSEPGSSF